MAAIRPFRPDDAEAIAALTLAAICRTARRAYSAAQVEAWAARYSVQRLVNGAAKGDVVLVAVDAADSAIAYASLVAGGHIDMLYCHPDHTRKGLAGALLTEAEAVARVHGITRLATEASELARPVFERAGFALLRRRDFTIPFQGNEVAIHNYAMEKLIG